MKMLQHLTKWQKLGCILAITFSAVGGLLSSVWPVKLSSIYEKIADGQVSSLKEGMPFIIAFGLTFVFAEAMVISRRVLLDIVSVSYQKRLNCIATDKLLHLKIGFFEEKASGEIAARISQAVEGAGQFLKAVANNVIPSVFIATFSVVQILKKAPLSIALILGSYTLVILFISRKQIKSQNGIREGLIGEKAMISGRVCQSIKNIEMIRVTNAESYEYNRFVAWFERLRGKESRHHMVMASFDGIKQITKGIYMIALLAYSIYQAHIGNIEAGMVITIMLLFQQLIVPIDSIHLFLDEIASSSVKTKALEDLLSEKSDEVFDIRTEKLVDGDEIVVNDVVVTSPNGKTLVTDNFSIAIKAGENVCLDGPTGSGKSSALKGIMRVYPAVGNITIGGVDIHDISQDHLCKTIYSMTQMPMLFAGSIRENLCFGIDVPITDHQMITALKRAEIYEELKVKDENVLDIQVTEGATNFSGGQRQRLVLARAFLRTPKFFFLDEATASLDVGTSIKVIENLKDYARSINAGILIVTHQTEIKSLFEHIVELRRVSDYEEVA